MIYGYKKYNDQSIKILIPHINSEWDYDFFNLKTNEFTIRVLYRFYSKHEKNSTMSLQHTFEPVLN